MAAKLTLRIEERLIDKAKMYAKQSGKSVSRLVADFFALLGQASDTEISPKVRSLKGLLKNSSIDTEDYSHHLKDKYL